MGRLGRGIISLAVVTLACASCDQAPDNIAASSIPENAAQIDGAAVKSEVPDFRGRIFRVGCRQGECRWARVLRLESFQATPRGELRRLTYNSGMSRYGWDDLPPEEYHGDIDITWNDRATESYAFCSVEQPSYAFTSDDDGLIVHRLDLFNVAGYEVPSASMYMRVCHDREFRWDDDPSVSSLGYREGTPSEQIEGATPESMTRF